MRCAAPRFSTTNIFLSLELERVKGVNTQKEFVDFTKEMKKDHVILVPDIFPVHMSLLTEVLRMYGYQVEGLHYTGQKCWMKAYSIFITICVILPSVPAASCCMR